MGGRPDRYARFVGSAAYREARREKAGVIAHLCRRHLESAERIADLGSGTGILKKTLELEFHKPVLGFEIDVPMLVERDRVAGADALCLPVADGTFDFVIANHLYEHVGDPALLFREIFRVLRPGGRAYVTAGSRLAVMEPHYRLPFLSWLPKGAAGAYVRLTGRGPGYERIRFLTYGPLVRRMTEAGFRITDDTERAIDELIEEVWGGGWARGWRVVRRLPGGLRQALLRLLSPQWFFLLERPGAAAGASGHAGSDGSVARAAEEGGEGDRATPAPHRAKRDG
ncbi:MAG: class I SAM-dependent methyltransferase [Gemmatimonadota bacterium]